MKMDEAPEPSTPVLSWHAVILDAYGEFSTETFETADQLAARLKELIDRDVSVSCFYGARVPISKPPTRYLMTPQGNIPLFAAPTEVEPDDSGYLGVDPKHLEDPPTLRPPKETPSTDSDEFFSDDDGDAINIFDSAMPDPDA
jgi:hypothetical protein